MAQKPAGTVAGSQMTLARKMDLLTRSRRIQAAGGFPVRNIKASPFLWPDFRSGTPEWHLIDLQTYIEEGFNLNSLIYSAIMYKVRSLWQVPLRAYTGDADHPEPLPADHPLAKLVTRPNPHQSFQELQGQLTVYMNLDGNAYVWFDRSKREDEQAIPKAMYGLRPDRVYVVPDKGKQGSGLLGYLYVPEGKSQWVHWNRQQRLTALEKGEVLAIPPMDMMHVKLPNPGDPLEGMGYGLSPLAAAGQSGDTDNKITSFLKLFFDHGAMPMGLLSFDVPMNDETVAAARRRFMDIYGGYDNWTDVAVLDQGGKYERITPTFQEMGFEGIDGRNESRILGPFGVPGMLIGARQAQSRSTYSNMEEARRLCWQDTLLPESQFFEVEWRYYLSDAESGTFVAYDYGRVPALQRDQPAMVTSWIGLVTHGVPKNTASQLVGLDIPKLADGDVIYMPLNLIPVGTIDQLSQPAARQPPAFLPEDAEIDEVPDSDDEDEVGAATAEDEERTDSTSEPKKKAWARRVGG